MVLLAEPPGAIVAIIAVVVVGVLTTAATLGVRGHARPRRARRPQTIEPRSSVTPAWTSPSISPISAARPGTSPARARPHFVGRSTKLPRLRGGRAAPTAPLTTRPRSGSAATAPAWLSPASCSSAATTSCANSATGPCSPPEPRRSVRAQPLFTPMPRGSLPACSCRHHRVDGLQRPSGRNASRNTPSTIMSPTRSHPGSWTKIRLGVRAHRSPLRRAHAPPGRAA